MDRREALKKISLILGGTIALPIATGFLAGCTPDSVAVKTQTLSALSIEQDKLVTVIAELIIPQTNTPGATAAGVNKFIDTMVFHWFSDSEKADFFTGMQDASNYCKEINGKDFLQCSEKEQIELLTALEREFLAMKNGPSKKAQFFNTMKQFTLIGFYTSEVGATQELRMPIMGQYLGDIPLGENDAAWAW